MSNRKPSKLLDYQIKPVIQNISKAHSPALGSTSFSGSTSGGASTTCLPFLSPPLPGFVLTSSTGAEGGEEGRLGRGSTGMVTCTCARLQSSAKSAAKFPVHTYGSAKLKDRFMNSSAVADTPFKPIIVEHQTYLIKANSENIKSLSSAKCSLNNWKRCKAKFWSSSLLKTQNLKKYKSVLMFISYIRVV